MELSKDLFDYLFKECQKFEDKTGHDVDVADILYSYLHSYKPPINATDSMFFILYDWDEGKGNDPFWNNELNEHSAIVFIKQMCNKIDEYAIQRKN